MKIVNEKFCGKRNTRVHFLPYFSVFLIIAVTGGSIPFMVYYTKVWLALFIIIALVTRFNKTKIRWHSSLLYLIVICAMMIMTSIYNNTYDTNFKRFILYGTLSFLLIGAFPLDKFKKYFLDVVTCISIISIFIFLASLYVHLPLKYLEGDNLRIGYFMFQAIEWNNVPLNRNTGIFTEAGCFQYCLNYTLILFMEDFICDKLNKNTKIKLFIVILALITCASTLGYFVLMAIIMYTIYALYRKRIIKLVFVGFPIGILSIGALYSSEYVSDKLNEDNASGSVIMRTADAYAMIQMIQEHPIIGNGGVETNKYKKKIVEYGALTGDTGATNGVLVAMAVLGVLWLPLYCYFCNKACKRIFSSVSSWFVVFLTLLIHCNEFFIFSPIIYIFLFPFKNELNGKKCQRSIYNGV